ncbi:hypothetical protein IMZ48_37840 [Candidatus Bathyarchaeota archaeon]|nr:hypothetical protein [Candidatus Bathyarchaeota archaeon]
MNGGNSKLTPPGLTKISIAAEETNLPPPTHNPSFEREEYISGLTHLLTALPPLTPSELSALQSPLPSLQLTSDTDNPPRGTYIRRVVKSGVLSLLLLAALLLPHALALVKAAARAERRLGLGKSVVGVVRGAGRRAGGMRGSGVVESLEWVGGSVMGGLVEGVEEGVEMLRRRNEPI